MNQTEKREKNREYMREYMRKKRAVETAVKETGSAERIAQAADEFSDAAANLNDAVVRYDLAKKELLKYLGA